jgi:hypothetical protein
METAPISPKRTSKGKQKRMWSGPADAAHLEAVAAVLDGSSRRMAYPKLEAERLRQRAKQMRRYALVAHEILTAMESGAGSLKLHVRLRELLAETVFAGTRVESI